MIHFKLHGACGSQVSFVHELAAILKDICGCKAMQAEHAGGPSMSGVQSVLLCREAGGSSSAALASSRDTAESHTKSLAEMQAQKDAKQAALASLLAGRARGPESSDTGSNPELPVCLSNLHDMQVCISHVMHIPHQPL